CPSVSVSSLGIPGIPQPPPQVSTHIPRPVSSIGQNRMESPAPTGRASSSMSGGFRSITSSPSIPKAHPQVRPVFSPSGSNSRLSNGVRSPLAGNARKTQLPMPSSRPSNQRSAFSPTSQYGREASSPIPSNYAPISISSRLNSGQQRQYGANGTYGHEQYGYGAQEGRSSPASSHLTSRQNHQGYHDERDYFSSVPRPGRDDGSSSSENHRGYHHERPLSDRMKIQVDDIEPYHATRGDELDEEFAKVVNRSPIQIQIRRLGEGKYYFGGRVDEQHNSLVGGKMVLCRLMEYGRIGSGEDDSGVSSGGSHSGTDDSLHPSTNNPRTQIGRRNPAGSLAASQAEEASRDSKKRPRKVLVRVGGGWQDLDIFLLDHSSLASENVTVRGY
ncbi:hypothetical protein BGX27_011383, partial [Mortierella sp. AM989]